jgi:hypothetical protein
VVALFFFDVRRLRAMHEGDHEVGPRMVGRLACRYLKGRVGLIEDSISRVIGWQIYRRRIAPRCGGRRRTCWDGGRGLCIGRGWRNRRRRWRFGTRGRKVEKYCHDQKAFHWRRPFLMQVAPPRGHPRRVRNAGPGPVAVADNRHRLECLGRTKVARRITKLT